MPNVVVLMATRNGAAWIDEQLDSIAGQVGVNVHMIFSDDGSTDETLTILARRCRENGRFCQLPHHEPLGSAAANFFRLIRDADILQADYIAFADQDDIWMNDKLQRAVLLLRATGASGYSSSVIAKFPDGRLVLVQKGAAQREVDYLFESPGPGCTIVLTRPMFLQVRDALWGPSESSALGRSFSYHDWLIYAIARASGNAWFIDREARMYYRQHDANEIGANVGWRAWRFRWARIRSGWYLQQVMLLCGFLQKTGIANVAVVGVSEMLRQKLSLSARIACGPAFVSRARRRLRDRVVLLVMYVSGLLWEAPSRRQSGGRSSL